MRGITAEQVVNRWGGGGEDQTRERAGVVLKNVNDRIKISQGGESRDDKEMKDKKRKRDSPRAWKGRRGKNRRSSRVLPNVI